MQVGIFEKSNADYHAGPELSCSDLKLLQQKTPLHLWAKKFGPNKPEKEQTPALLLGTAIHCAILEPEEFPLRFAEVPEGIDRRSKAGKEFFDELKAGGRDPLTATQAQIVKGVSEAARKHPFIGKLLRMSGKVEQSIYWQDPMTGVMCKIRPDYMIEPCDVFPNGLILDVKSAEDASESGFTKASYNYGYHMQAPWYQDGFQATFGTSEPPLFVFAAFEKEEPFAVAAYLAGEHQIALGRAINRRLLNLYAECLESDKWPGYQESPTVLGLPAWGMKELQDLQQTEGA